MKLTNDEILQENINITKQYVKDHGGKVSSLPTATADLVGQIYQYTGTTTSTYTHGYFYECKNNGGTYSWENIPTGSSTDVDAYHSSDTTETSIADNDYIPFYDTSASSKKKSLWSNIKSVLKTYFDGIYITSHQDISGKADKVSSATNNNFAALDANGNLKDSGHKHSDYLTQHQDISGKADKVSNATNGHLAGLDANGNLTDSGIDPTDLDSGHTILNGSGTAMNQRSKLQFEGMGVTDDSTNDKTVVTAPTIKQDGITGTTVNRFGICSTAAETATKTVSITTGTFSLEAGAGVSVKFNNANTASTPTLNVNSTGAKNIYHKGSQITTGDNKALLAGTVDFIYDGTQWHLVGNYIDTEVLIYTKEVSTNTSTNTNIDISPYRKLKVIMNVAGNFWQTQSNIYDLEKILVSHNGLYWSGTMGNFTIVVENYNKTISRVDQNTNYEGNQTIRIYGIK